VLERAVLAGQAASEPGSQMSTRWRARRDSNSRPLPSENSALPEKQRAYGIFRVALLRKPLEKSPVARTFRGRPDNASAGSRKWSG
jgi:hypothetical protein